MNAWNNSARKRDLDDRKADVRSKARFEDVVVMLDLLDAGAPHANCPHTHCGAVASLKSCRAGCGYYCGVCGEKGDMINLVQAARDVGFVAAIEILEEELPARRDARTARLL